MLPQSGTRGNDQSGIFAMIVRLELQTVGSLSLNTPASPLTVPAMKIVRRLLAPTLLALLFSSCATSRSAFTPVGGPPTVGMPAELSERERSFMPEVVGSLKNVGYVPVRHGSGDMELTFEIAEGPINTDTKIELSEQGRLLAKGQGRGAGVPMIGRAGVARKSFDRAFSEFQSSLPGFASGRRSMQAPAESAGSDENGEFVY